MTVDDLDVSLGQFAPLGTEKEWTYIVLYHLFTFSSSFLFVDPIRLEPMIMWNLTVGRFRRGNLRSPSDHIRLSQ
jgi:hypothetical protein